MLNYLKLWAILFLMTITSDEKYVKAKWQYSTVEHVLNIEQPLLTDFDIYLARLNFAMNADSLETSNLVDSNQLFLLLIFY